MQEEIIKKDSPKTDSDRDSLVNTLIRDIQNAKNDMETARI